MTTVPPESIALERAWQLLEEDERKELWRFVGHAVQSLQAPKGAPRADNSEYDALCAGVQALDRSPSAKAAVFGLPRGTRRLSSGELQKAVARHKEKLFTAPFVRGFFARIYSRWVQLERTDLLIAVLDAFKCEHDEIGKLIGPMPSIAQADAVDVLLRMASSRSAHQLRIVCAGLMLNSPAWDAALTAAIDALSRVAEATGVYETPERVELTEDAPNSACPGEPGRSSKVSAIIGLANSDINLAEAVESLAGKLAALRVALLSAAEQAEQQVVPSSAGTVSTWTELEEQLREVSRALGVESRALSDLTTGLSLATVRSSMRELASECLRVTVRAGSKDVSVVTSRAEQLLLRSDDSTAEELQLLAKPIEALLSLVNSSGSLSDEQAGSLFQVVSDAFGPGIALAAVRGNLVVGNLTDPAAAKRPSHISDHPYEQSTAAVQRDEAARTSIEEFDASPEREQQEPVSHNVVAGTPTGDLAEPAEAQPSHSPPQAPREGYQVTQPLGSLADFQRLHWLDEMGSVRRAPWADPEFSSQLAASAETAWADGHFDIAALLSSAANALGTGTRLVAEDITSAERLFADPSDLSVARDPRRLGRIRAGDQLGAQTAELAVCLEALAPTFPVTMSNQEVSTLLDSAELRTGALRTVVEFLLNGWAALVDPIALIRLDTHHKGADPQILARMLADAQSHLRQVLATQWNAAGGRIIHTHCRRAWSEFVRTHVGPLRDLMAPAPDVKKPEPWTVLDARRRVAQLGQAFTRIMTEQHVLHQDRVAAVSAAEQIVTAMEGVVSAKQQYEDFQRRKRPGAVHAVIPRQAIGQVLKDLPSDPHDRLCVLLMRSVLTGERVGSPFALPVGNLLRCPDLVRMLRAVSLRRADLVEGVSAADFQGADQRAEDAKRLIAAAAVLVRSGQGPVPPVHSRDDLLVSLRDIAVGRERWDLLAALSAAEVLAPHERTQLHRRALEVGDRAFEQAQRLLRAWTACETMRAPDAPLLKDRVDEAMAACSDAPERPLPETHLLLAWLEGAVRAAEGIEALFSQVRLGQVREKVPSRFAEFEALVAGRDYPSAMAILDMIEPAGEDLEKSPRRTMWRTDGVKRFAQPRSALIKELKGVNQAQNALVSEWAQAESDDPSYRDSLRRALYDVVSGEAQLGNEKGRRGSSIRLSDLREHLTRKTIIKCPAIREYFKTARLNPTFLPQLAEFDQIVLTSGSFGQGGGSPDAYIRLAALEPGRSLAVFLEPGLPLGRRDELVTDLRRRKAAAVILDDIDICRVCSISTYHGEHNFVPFLEIVFEQLDLDMASPFSSSDGQHIKLETFVGRIEDAAQVALQWKYSRLFSGRKLGKSAFLRHVASKFDGHKLGDQKSLRVIFISIAGGDSEAWVVNSIIEEMKRRLAFLEDLSPTARQDAPERLMEYINRYASERPNEHVLLILDEADAFVEEQLRLYDSNGARKRESTLSFRMMKQMPTSSDADEMPRFRVLFSGYRVTNTRGGVWANAGDVLILQPLIESEAVRFLQGMLGRIGIDVGQGARYAARRCGFQPAVLIRFGESLLKRIRRNSRLGARETYAVTDADVVAAMNDQLVLDEIRTVVNNNFQGDRVAATIFGATLLALKDLEPGMALTHGPGQVLAKLSEIDPQLDWLSAGGASPLAQIERQLQEFIDRELLASDSPRFGDRQYRLKFPHFLPVLTAQSDVALEVRQHIHFLRTGRTGQRLIESVLPESSLENLRYWFRQADRDLCTLVIAAGHWKDGLQNGKAGVPDRLGVAPPGVTSGVNGVDLAQRVSSGSRVFIDVGEEDWHELAGQLGQRPLVALGGIDLLRSALRHVLEGAEPQIDIVPFSPLSERAIAWWFESVRALDFKSANAIARIAVETGGIPLLVGAFDSMLSPSNENIGEPALAAAIGTFRESLPALASSLVNGPVQLRLSSRELELLKIVCHVARDGLEEFDLEVDLPDYWGAIAESSSDWVPPMGDSADRLAFQVLLSSGLLSASPSPGSRSSALGRVLVPKAGPLVRLIGTIGEHVG